MILEELNLKVLQPVLEIIQDGGQRSMEHKTVGPLAIP